MNALEMTLAGLARRLDAAGVAYVVIGGYANLYWGRPRLTEDLDVTVRVDERGLVALLAALTPAFRARVEDPVVFARETAVVPLESSEGVRVDLIVARLPLEEVAIERGIVVKVGGAAVRFATAEDLILSKLVSERLRDREDVEGIARRQRGKLDLAYLRPRVAELARGLQRPNLIVELEQLLRDTP